MAYKRSRVVLRSVIEPDKIGTWSNLESLFYAHILIESFLLTTQYRTNARKEVA